MNRIVNVELMGKEYPMAYSLGAQEEFEVAFGGLASLGKAMQDKGSTAVVMQALAILLKYGARRKKQFEGADIEPVDIETLKDVLMPYELEDITQKMFEALKKGQENEIKGEPTTKKKAEE